MIAMPKDSSSNLNKHLERFHLSKITNAIEQMMMASDQKIKEWRNFKFSQENSRMKLGKMIMLHELPFLIVDKCRFKNFVSSLQPQFTMISKYT